MAVLDEQGTLTSRKNIFVIARRAGRRDREDPLRALRRDEDQLTEMLAYLFQEAPAALAAWLRTLGEPGLDALGGWAIDTQYVLPTRRRPDLVLVAPKRARVVVECKIDSSEGLNQLSDYAQHLREACHEPTRILLYLTATEDMVDPNLAGRGVRFVPQRWRVLAEALLAGDDRLARDFVALLEEEKLVTPKPLTSTEFEMWSAGYELSDRMLELVDDAIKRVSTFPQLGFQKLGYLNMSRGSVYRLANGTPTSVALSIAPTKGRPGGPRVGIHVLHADGQTRSSAELRELGHHVEGWEFALEWGDWPSLKRPLLEVMADAHTHDEQVEALVSVAQQALDCLAGIGYLPPAGAGPAPNVQQYAPPAP